MLGSSLLSTFFIPHRHRLPPPAFHQELNKYRAKCSMLFHYDWISIPLVYTQVTASPSPVPLSVLCCVRGAEN